MESEFGAKFCDCAAWVGSKRGLQVNLEVYELARHEDLVSISEKMRIRCLGETVSYCVRSVCRRAGCACYRAMSSFCGPSAL